MFLLNTGIFMISLFVPRASVVTVGDGTKTLCIGGKYPCITQQLLVDLQLLIVLYLSVSLLF